MSTDPNWETGKALAAARWDRGQRTLTEDEEAALSHAMRWGAEGYPVQKMGSGRWYWAFRSLKAPTLYRTKRDAVAAWEVALGIYAGIKAKQAQERALTELQAKFPGSKRATCEVCRAATGAAETVGMGDGNKVCARCGGWAEVTTGGGA